MPVGDHENLPNVGLIFDEQYLRSDIIRVWGEHGAHIDVFDHMLRLCREQAIKLDQARIDIKDLRAALATQPQPLFEGPAFEFCQSSTHPTTRVVVYPAVAGSATPTERDDAEDAAAKLRYRYG